VCRGGLKIEEFRAPWKTFTEIARIGTYWFVEYEAPTCFFKENDGNRIDVRSFRDIPGIYWRQKYIRLVNPVETSHIDGGVLSHASLSLYIVIETNRFSKLDAGNLIPHFDNSIDGIGHIPFRLQEYERRAVESVYAAKGEFMRVMWLTRIGYTSTTVRNSSLVTNTRNSIMGEHILPTR